MNSILKSFATWKFEYSFRDNDELGEVKLAYLDKGRQK